eukprot:CAMPEP_0115617388 /NCGR_PEP_ID=MMETSP0272-20121206/23620_1 /TAXON_ID=71861 /ORGANISM="Scrippsiella trochoidea, Strain CCMP3099" /LENGTH=290 /DNA_ID=CAMNT_0003053345 /DNA_START=453 /DNA_END=1323 /DNA_ORIENTATION=+
MSRLGHLEQQQQGALPLRSKFQRHRALQLCRVVPRKGRAARCYHRALHTKHIGLALWPQLQRGRHAVRPELDGEDVAILVDEHRCRGLAGNIANDVGPLVAAGLCRHGVPNHRAVVGSEARAPGQDPRLDETQVLSLIKIVLRVSDASACGHELDATPAERLLIATGVLMRQAPIHHEGDDLHVVVWMRAEATRWLHQVVVHDAQDAEGGWSISVLSEAEVKPGLQPITVRPPCRLRRAWLRIGVIAKPLGGGSLTNKRSCGTTLREVSPPAAPLFCPVQPEKRAPTDAG